MSQGLPQRLGAGALLGAAIVWIVLVTVLPSPAVFATDAALEHVAAIAPVPHPVGSAAQSEAASYLLTELEEMGISGEMVPGTAGGRAVQNVVARVRGSDPSGTVLVVTHYDSVPAGPGAGDNATGTAVVLEALRSVAAADPRNDVVVLFEDGEELGYLGGYAFVRSEAAMSDIAAVMGVDTGAWGPSYVLEVGPTDGAVLDVLKRLDPPPLGDSLLAATNSDIGGDDHEATLFMDLGIPGISIEDTTASSRKHTPGDTIEGIRPAAIAHLGVRVEGLLSGLADTELTRGGGESVWFRLPVLGVVSHAQALWWILDALGIAALAVALFVRRSDLVWRRIGVVTLRTVGAVAAGAVLGTAATLLFEVSNGTGLNVQPSVMWLWALGHLLVAAAITAALVLPAVRRAVPLESAVGVAVVLALFALVMGGAFPRSGYAFAWPLILLGAGALGLALRPRLGPLVLLPASLGALLLMGPALMAGYRGAGLTVLGPLALFVALVSSLAVPVLVPPADRAATTG